MIYLTFLLNQIIVTIGKEGTNIFTAMRSSFIFLYFKYEISWKIL